MKPSSRVARFAAYFVDILIVGLIQAVVGSMFPNFKILGTISGIAYFCLLTYYQGASLGKRLFWLKVVPETGSKLTWRHVLLREVIGKIISGLILGLGYIWIFFDKRRQGWHDKIAQTLVVEVKPLSGFRKVLAYFFAVLMLLIPILSILAIIFALVMLATGGGVLQNNQLPSINSTY